MIMVSPVEQKVMINDKLYISSQLSKIDIVSLTAKKQSLVNRFIKRLFDIFVSSLAIVITSPLLLIIATIIKLSDGGPILFKQTRVGLRGKTFCMYKFRSMIINAEQYLPGLKEQNEMNGGVLFKIKDDPRVTKIGKFIRKFSIDELPQLFNVLNGTMSIVGPRPALPSEVEEYEMHHLNRLFVKQGLTCYWQCSGRNSLPFEDQMRLDIKYVENNNIFIDIWIILKTIPTILLGRGQ